MKTFIQYLSTVMLLCITIVLTVCSNEPEVTPNTGNTASETVASHCASATVKNLKSGT